MKAIGAGLSSLAGAMIVIAIIFAINSCAERNQSFKLECMKTGGTVVSTSNDLMCIQGSVRTK